MTHIVNQRHSPKGSASLYDSCFCFRTRNFSFSIAFFKGKLGTRRSFAYVDNMRIMIAYLDDNDKKLSTPGDSH